MLQRTESLEYVFIELRYRAGVKNNEHQKYLKAEVTNTDIPKDFVLNSKCQVKRSEHQNVHKQAEGWVVSIFPSPLKAERC